MTQKQVSSVKVYAKKFHKKSDQFHGWDHILAVARNAKLLAKKSQEEVDLNILLCGCYLHDIGRSVSDEGHAERSVKMSQAYLQKLNVDDSEIAKTCHAIISHDRDQILSAKTIEAKILFDADKMEIFTVYGFMRVFAFLVCERQMGINEAFDFLWKWSNETRDRLHIPWAKAVAKKELQDLSKLKDRFKNWPTYNHKTR